MDTWYKDYKENSEEYLELFNEVMQDKQEQNIVYLRTPLLFDLEML